MKHKLLFFFAALTLYVRPATLDATEPSKLQSKPNVIFILADDLGIGNVGYSGPDNYKSPNIDKLASTGIRFTHAYTGALCGPSRALIMSGR